MFLRIFVQTNEIKGFEGRLWQEILHVRELRVRPAQALRQGPSKGTTKHYQSLSLSDLVMTSNMIWGKTPPPLCDFVQWLDTEQSQQDKDHVERQARWAAQRWQRMLHEEDMEEKCKKDQVPLCVSQKYSFCCRLRLSACLDSREGRNLRPRVPWRG